MAADATPPQAEPVQFNWRTWPKDLWRRLRRESAYAPDPRRQPPDDRAPNARLFFEDSPSPQWVADFSAVKHRLEQLARAGPNDLEPYLDEHPELVAECAALVKVTRANPAALALYEAVSLAALPASLDLAHGGEGGRSFRAALAGLARGQRQVVWENSRQTAAGATLDLHLRWSVFPGYEDTLARVLVVVADITERKRIEAALRESEALFRATFEHSPGGVALVRPDGMYLKVNSGLCELLGYTEAELVGHRTLEFMHPDDVRDSYAQAQRLGRGEIPTADIEKRYIHRSGRVIWTQRVMVAPQIDGNPPRYFISLVHDISAWKQAEQDLLKSNNQLTAGLAEMEERTREMERLNELVSVLQTCQTPEEAYGVVSKLAPALFPNSGGALGIVPASHNRVETVAAWGAADYSVPQFPLDDCWALRRALPHVVLDGPQGLNCRHLSGTPPAYICVPLFALGESLGILHVNAPASQLSDRKQQYARTVAAAIAQSIANLRLRESLRQQSIVDVLTGLFNRRYMEETLEREVRRCGRAQRPLTIIMLDLDHFKQFNDTYGHAAGDILLGELGAVLRSQVRMEDIACRYGGEEFTLILPDSSLAATAQRAERLRASLQGLRIEYQGKLLGPVTASLGLATFPEHGPDGARVLRMADEALYQAKRAGGNRVATATVVIEPGIETQAQETAGK